MKKSESESGEKSGLSFRPRATEEISIAMPKEALASLKQVATHRDMSVQALLKFYIGNGLRQDITNFFGTRVLETTEAVLARHLRSEEEVRSIIREIRTETELGPEASDKPSEI